MKKNKILTILIAGCLLPVLPVLAQATSTVEFGEHAAVYTEVEEVDAGHRAYYRDGNLVLSVFDTNEDGRDDLYIRYTDEGLIDLEASDSDNDGEIDTVRQFKDDGEIVSATEPEFEPQPVDLPENPNPQSPSAEPQKTINKSGGPEPLEPFSLNPAPTESKFHIPWKILLFLAAGGGAAIYAYKTRKPAGNKE